MAKENLKRILKLFFLALLICLIGILSFTKIYHEYSLRKEEKKLAQYDVGKRYNIDGKSINIFQYEHKQGKETLVYMQGLGCGDTTISTRPMFDKLEDLYNICIIDRAGNGMSSDTGEKRTVDKIVDEYRKCLNQAEENEPYILVAHSISGMYADYWASKYPDEIKAIIYLDATPAECYLQEGKPTAATLIMAHLENILSWTGLQRFIVSEKALIGNDENAVYSEKQRMLCHYLMYHNTYSKATLSEIELYYQNAKTVQDNLNIDGIPKLYIAADKVNGSYYENVYKKQLEEKYDGDEKQIEENRKKFEASLSDRVEIIKKNKNVVVQYVSGPHTIYKYAPYKVAELIINFLKDENINLD